MKQTQWNRHTLDITGKVYAVKCVKTARDLSRVVMLFCGFDQYTLGALQSGDVYTDDSDVSGQLSLCTVVVSHSCGVSIACVTARPGTSTLRVCVCVCVCVCV